MKKTQEALTAKMVLGQIFLLLAALVVASMFVDIPLLNKGLYQIYPESNGSNIGDSLSGMLRFILAGTLLFHYAYAGLYYPLKYKRYFRLMNRGTYTEEFPVFDLSAFRGIASMAVIVLLFLTNMSWLSLVVHVTLVAICWLLGYLTATNRMFNKTSAEVNSLAIIMALQNQGEINVEECHKTGFNSLSFLEVIKYPQAVNRDLAIKNYSISQKEQLVRIAAEERARKQRQSETIELSVQLAKEVR